MSGIVSIDAWAEESGAGRRPRRCAVCVLPPNVLTEITRGWTELGYRSTLIAAYLEAAGHPISKPKLVYHFGTHLAAESP